MKSHLLPLILCSTALLVPWAGRAEPNNHNTDWMSDSHYGVFMHFLPADAAGLALVKRFDVESLSRQLASVGSSYFVITLGQNSGYFISPNASYDRITGYAPGERCSTRDLPIELSQRLKSDKIKLLLYLPCQTPNGDARAQAAFGLPEGAKDQPVNLTFAKKWAEVIQEWSDRYGDSVAGWWFDGGYQHVNFNEAIAVVYAAAAKHGNPKAIVTFNPGVQVIHYTEAEDYTAGELNDPFDAIPTGRWLQGSQWHALTFLGSNWSRRNTRYPTQRWVTWVQAVSAQGGAVTLDMGPNWDPQAGPIGSLSEAQIAQVSAIKQATAPSSQTARIAQAADAFLATLNDAQRAKVIFDFADKAQRARWSNLPLSMAERRGLRMGDLTEPQRSAVMTLLSATLSKMGYEKVVGIIEADESLKGNGQGRGPVFGRNEFVVSFLGKPSATAPWMLQFGGHHLALNVTFVGEEGVMTPSLIAVQPARYTLNGQTMRPLGRETDKAFELINALDAAQRKQAILGFQMRDLVLGPGHDGEVIQPEGIKASELTVPQKQMLLELVAEWAGIIHDTAAARKLAEIKANLAETWFAWSGPTEPGTAAYFRVQGPTLVIEFAPQKLGGDATQHIHTMYRDFTNDYGKKLLAR